MELTEGRRTGIPKMCRALENNGSPEPVFYTDAARLSFWAEIKIHPEFSNERVPATILEAPDEALFSETELKILQLCLEKTVDRNEVLSKFGHKTMSGNVKKALRRLKALDLIELTIEDKPNSKNQRYRITKKGKDILRRN